MVINSGNGHTAKFIYNNTEFVLLSVAKDNNNRTEIVFYDTGRVTIQRLSNGSWKPAVTLREAD